jgi:cysteine sulfinate desulfinase/cysteine desulfurase-like protein
MFCHSQKINSNDFISSGYEGNCFQRSACQSGSIKAHVAEMLSHADLKKPSLISFSHYNSKEDIDLLIEALKKYLEKPLQSGFSVFRYETRFYS